MMKTTDQEIERFLTLLRNKIRERGFTQLQVQSELDWGRSYISQLLTRQKALRVEQVLLILDVIGVSPQEFFGELYGPLPAPDGEPPSGRSAAQLEAELAEFRSTFHGVVDLLLGKGLMTADELDAAISGSGEAADGSD